MKHLKNNYYVIPVDVESSDISAYYKPIQDKTFIDFLDKNEIYSEPIILDGKWEITGAATADEISFDCEQCVDSNGWGCYDNYKGIPDNRYTCTNKEDSFYSLLASAGFYFTNPMREKPKRYVPFMGSGQYTQYELREIEEYEKELKSWQSYEERLVQKLLIVKKL